MTDLAFGTTTYEKPDLSWLKGTTPLAEALSGVARVASFDAAAHYPNNFLLGGLLLGRHTSGANAGKLGPFTPGGTTGLQVVAGIVSGLFSVRLTAGGVPRSAEILGSYIPVGVPAQIHRGLLPFVSPATGNPRAVTSAELTSNTAWVEVPS